MQVTVSAGKLKRIVGAVAPYASTDDTTPILRCVRLVVHGHWLVAYATDRHTLGACRAELDPADIDGPFDVLLGPDTVKAVTAPAWNRGAPKMPVDIVINDYTVTLKDDLSMVTHARPDGTFPNVWNLFVPRADNPAAVRRDVAFNPDLLARYAKVQEQTALDAKNEILRVNVDGKTGALVTVSIGTDFVGMIMPCVPMHEDEPVGAPLDGAAWFAEMRTEAVRAG